MDKAVADWLAEGLPGRAAKTVEVYADALRPVLVVVGATPRLGELRCGETIPWRVIAAQIAPRERRGSR